MYEFYVVLKEKDSHDFFSIRYKTENEILNENDLLAIENQHLKPNVSFRFPTVQIISWQRINSGGSMEFTDREKELLWRGLCDSEKSERDRITSLTENHTPFNKQTKQRMTQTSQKRLKEIDALKNKWLRLT